MSFGLTLDKWKILKIFKKKAPKCAPYSEAPEYVQLTHDAWKYLVNKSLILFLACDMCADMYICIPKLWWRKAYFASIYT